ncbi:peptidase inhibitor family I36 protein [Streptomyces monomycini]|uniref:peptidase inhibitor family I36 protein n=1 Tax=Streptomyces monomycini TaxID=371720 RepID=UPI0004AB1127|nr:peptidase inhibitor family I36 protein [Streptomyces monomycini]
MRMGRIAALSIGIATLTAGAVVPAVAHSSEGAAQIRQTQSDSGDRARGALWLYQNSHYKGGKKKITSKDANFRNNYFSNGKSLNDRVSSVKNRSSKAWRLYKDAGYHGPSTKILPNHQLFNLRSTNVGNDAASSVK